MDIFEEFDKMIDVEGLKSDLNEAEQNGGAKDYDDVPYGNYVVRIEKLELVASKKGSPMLTCWFKVVEGEQKDRLIFMNQVITQGFQLHVAKEFLKSLESGLDITFDSYKQFGSLILDVHETINDKLEYELEYAVNKKGYNVFTIKEVFDV